MGNFERAHAFTSKWEGGFSDHHADPGGTTNFGISLGFLRAQGLEVGDIDGDGDIDAEDIRALTGEDAARLMRREFWDALGLDSVKPLCAAVVYDTAVNMGPVFARRAAQQALGVKADGVWGPVTRAALATCDDRKTAAAMCHVRRARYVALAREKPALAVFLRGWLRRVDALESMVEALPAKSGTPVPDGVVVIRRAGGASAEEA